MFEFRAIFVFPGVWPIPHLERIRDGFFPPWVAKPRRREKKFPHEWLSRNSERVFLHERRSREWRNSVSLWLLSHEWGNFPIPNSLQMRNNILMLKRKLEPSEKDFYLLVHIYYDPQRGHPLMISNFFGPFLTYLPTHIRFSPYIMSNIA